MRIEKSFSGRGLANVSRSLLGFVVIKFVNPAHSPDTNGRRFKMKFTLHYAAYSSHAACPFSGVTAQPYAPD